MKVEMRWIERKTGHKFITVGQTEIEQYVKVLQYRWPEHTFNSGPDNSTTIWSEWQDVPTVKEENETRE